MKSIPIPDRRPPAQWGHGAGSGSARRYFPVFYAEPLQGNQKALGFDLASDCGPQ